MQDLIKTLTILLTSLVEALDNTAPTYALGSALLSVCEKIYSIEAETNKEIEHLDEILSVDIINLAKKVNRINDDFLFLQFFDCRRYDRENRLEQGLFLCEIVQTETKEGEKYLVIRNRDTDGKKLYSINNSKFVEYTFRHGRVKNSESIIMSEKYDLLNLIKKYKF
jgi:hypothetical protein